jgi:hypothetical protein
VLEEVRFYPPEGPALTAYGGVDELLDIANGSSRVIMEARPAERMVETLVPLKWPEYRHVTDLPFSELLYASVR